MRTNVVIDDGLMLRVMKSGGYKTKKKAIEEALKLLLQVQSQERLRSLKGRVHWEGDLDQMRSD